MGLRKIINKPIPINTDADIGKFNNSATLPKVPWASLSDRHLPLHLVK